MKRLTIGLTALALNLTSTPAWSAPRIEVQPNPIAIEGEIRQRVDDWGFMIIEMDYSPNVFTVFNRGDEPLVVEGMSYEPDYDWFWINPQEFEVAPGASRRVDIWLGEFPPEGRSELTLHIRSNDPDQNDLPVDVTLDITIPGFIHFQPPNWPNPAYTGRIYNLEACIDNETDDDLEFVIEVEIVREPEGLQRDDPMDLLVFNPAEGVVEPHESLEIAVTLDTRDMRQGEYIINVHIFTNDPDCEEYIWELDLFLENAPRLVVEPEAFELRGFWGWEGFDDGFFGPDAILTLFNTGDANLEAGLSADREWVVLNVNECVIEPEGGQEIEITVDFGENGFNPEDTRALVRINSNDPERPRVEVPITLIPLRPPTIVVDPLEIEPGLCCCEIFEFAITIANIGDAELRWEVSLSILAQPEGQDIEEPWITFEPARGRLAPHQNWDMFVTLNPIGLLAGDYEAVLEVNSNDPVHSVVEIHAYMPVLGVPDIETPWPEAWGYPDWLDFNRAYEELLTFHEYRLPIVIHNEGTDVLEIADIRSPIVQFRAEPRELSIEAREGAEAEIDIVFFTEEAGSFETNLVIISNDPDEGEIRLPVRAIARDDPPQVIALRRGWNMLSTNRTPPEGMRVNGRVDVARMLAQLAYQDNNGNQRHHIEMFKDERGRFYVPQWNFCNIHFWNLAEGYQVKVDANCQLEFHGELIPFDTDVPISAGWNIIAYFPDYRLSCGYPNYYAFRSIWDHLCIVKDEMGRFLNVGWINVGLQDLWPGEGYQVLVDADVILNYPAQQERGGSSVESPLPQPKHFTAPLNTGRNMSLLVKELSLENGMKDFTGCELSVISPEGLAVGASAIEKNFPLGIPLWGDDPTTDQIDGAREGEALSFRLWDGRREMDLTPTWLEGEGVYRTDGFAVVSLTSETLVVDDFSLTASPNPFNSGVEVRFNAPIAVPVSVDIVDANGRCIAWQQIVSLKNQGSAYFNASAWPAGMYLIHAQSGDKIRTVKVLCLK